MTGSPGRRFVQRTAGTLGAAALGCSASAQQAAGVPPSTVTIPAREWGRHAPPAIYPDPDVIVVDPAFNAYRIGNVGMHRMATGFQWAEGPAGSGQGHYLVFGAGSGPTQY